MQKPSNRLVARSAPARPRRSCTGRSAARPRGWSTGLLHDWQQRNRASSLPLALRQLEAAGNLGNLRLAIAGAHEGYRGPVFMDSDLYKTLEAIGWELARAATRTLAGFAQRPPPCWRRRSSRTAT